MTITLTAEQKKIILNEFGGLRIVIVQNFKEYLDNRRNNKLVEKVNFFSNYVFWNRDTFGLTDQNSMVRFQRCANTFFTHWGKVPKLHAYKTLDLITKELKPSVLNVIDLLEKIDINKQSFNDFDVLRISQLVTLLNSEPIQKYTNWLLDNTRI